MKTTTSRSLWRFLLATILLIGEPSLGATDSGLEARLSPLLPAPVEWRLGDYWKPTSVGNHDFYFAEQGNYIRTFEEHTTGLRQTGFLDRMIPGHWRLHPFDQAKSANLPPAVQNLVAAYLENRWPITTTHYCVTRGNPPPTMCAIQRVGDLWLGDSMPEAPIYRLEPVFHFLQTGRKWNGSSMDHVEDAPFENWLRERVVPRLEEKLPCCRDPNHSWTRAELRTLCDIYCEEFFAAVPNNRPIAWGMFLSPHHIAAMPNVRTIAEKGADAFRAARARGMMRQSGGGKVLYTWRGHEPTERYAYPKRGWFSINRDQWGYPLPHVWYYVFRPYLIGANYSMIEGFPGNLIQDIEGDGQFEPTTLGHIANALLDFTDRHPKRGIPYTPVALVMEYTRGWPTCYHSGGSTFGAAELPYDDADHMNHGLFYDLIFPEHRHTRFSGGYSRTAPYGEIFDILSPKPGKALDPRILGGYKVVIGMGGLKPGLRFSAILRDYVEAGGCLVMNTADLGSALDFDFFGLAAEGPPRSARTVCNERSGREFAEAEFDLQPLRLLDAEALYTSDGDPVVTVRRIGSGHAILVAARHMIQSGAIESRDGISGRAWKKKPVLRFVDDLLESLTTSLTPFKISRPPASKPDLSWQINRKGEGWTVTLYNYSLKREELVARATSTAKVIAEYPYKSVPFKIVCRAPMKDVVELFGDRDVAIDRENGSLVVSESMRGGEIRVYEFQPDRIELPLRDEHPNLVLNRPVSASSTLVGSSPQAAVDGRRDNDVFWQSDLDPARRYVLDLPQWLQVDLGKLRTIDHVFVLFHTWPQASLHTRQFIYQYVVEASTDGEDWRTILDESRNIDPARPEGLERWFKPVEARYVRLVVTSNSAQAGVQLVELEVRGPETRRIHPTRQPVFQSGGPLPHRF